MASIERRIAALEGLIPPPAPPKEEADESAAREGEGRARLRAAFEEEYGSIEMIGRIVAPDYQGGWVDEYRLLEDGTVETTHHEGSSEEALRIRREARQRGPVF